MFLNDRIQEDNELEVIRELDAKIVRYSRVAHYVLITGERGTGKTTIAKRLHDLSPRSGKQFINLNCASLSQELLESELFGYEKGAFTGAAAAKTGLFESASGGTLFLDEIGELSLHLQAKLLKAVEEKSIRRVGSSVERTVDTRIISATSQDLKRMVAEGRFRPDLYDRLNVLGIETIPLRRQKPKIAKLLMEALQREGEAAGREHPFQLTDQAMTLLQNYEWRGNFRELKNFATCLVVECLDDDVISYDKVRQVLSERQNGLYIVKNTDFIDEIAETDKAVSRISSDDVVTVSFNLATDDLESIYLKAAGTVIDHILASEQGSFRKAAKILGVKHTTLSRIMDRLNAQIKRPAIPAEMTYRNLAATA